MRKKAKILIRTAILAVIIITTVVLISGCLETPEKSSIKENQNISKIGTLEEDIKNANHIVWMFPHADDEVYVPGLFAISSLDYNKKTSARWIGSGQLKDAPFKHPNKISNWKSKEVLELNGYAYVGNDVNDIIDKLKQEQPDIIVTFDPANGYGGLNHKGCEQHANSAKLAGEAI